MLPNFLVIGAPKAGTTSLYEYLKAHPEVFMSTPKELNYFSQEANLARGLGWYESHFAGAADALAIGENSPQYTLYPWADLAPRVAQVLPAAKLIYIMRDPVERTISHHQWSVVWQKDDPDPARALWRKGPNGEPPFYLSISRYAQQIESYLAHFPREQMLLITTEALRDDRRATMAEVFAFLDVDPTAQPPTLEREYNRTADHLDRKVPRAEWLSEERRVKLPGYSAVKLLPRPVRDRARRLLTRGVRVEVSSRLRARIADELRDDVARLAGYMGPGFDGWGLL